ncbi:hypothetical protein ELG83_10505 [Rhizobium leguminosarum]|uniref:hypothetical protein n=1 Tax=Rhizobium leguminosarum TaxID=384 RepID=UPI00103093F4|nr:hypothetical protein [Rhizobium leguminosarum]TBF94521.1 hypothetical protein ELG83_10505 [Rhizobium leguminosarum]
MAIGDVVPGCSVVFREWRPHWVNVWRIKSTTVEHVGRNRVMIQHPKKGTAVRKSLTAKRIEIVTRGGRDLVAEWREVPVLR